MKTVDANQNDTDAGWPGKQLAEIGEKALLNPVEQQA